MENFDWSIVVAAILGVIGVVATQVLLSRGEPAKLKTLRILNDALEKYDVDDQGRAELRTARVKIAQDLAATLTSPAWWQRLTAARSGFLSVAVGLILATIGGAIITWFAPPPASGSSDIGDTFIAALIASLSGGAATIGLVSIAARLFARRGGPRRRS
ncbi:hypothetical protein [Plantibacter sp. CFBP 8775]|uniref:hypothetical protein n=1 Tax=Plantibacter sp. CFBP 8775 TaxID=2774038 RepID=UPI0017833103|nr:hypothetical protein [Plantibacter sp. CFBP 8775]MBD8104752.1 hypothetical protein [Plantibacter sp. CFBP 8775]